MSTHAAPDRTLPFELGEPRSFAGLTVFPLFASEPAGVEYVGLDEAANCGLAVTEVDEAGSVPFLRLVNPLEARAVETAQLLEDRPPPTRVPRARGLRTVPAANSDGCSSPTSGCCLCGVKQPLRG